MAMRLDPASYSSYQSSVDTHRRANYAANYDGLMLRLRNKDHGLNLGRAKALRVAIMWWEECNGVFWTDQQKQMSLFYVKTTPLGAEDEATEKAWELEPGTIDEDMLPEFFQGVININRYREARRMKQYDPTFVRQALLDMSIAFLTGLRSEQMVSLTKKNFLETDGTLYLHIPKIHDPKASIREQVIMLKIPVIPHASYTKYLLERLSDKNPSERVCPDWHVEEKYNELLCVVHS